MAKFTGRRPLNARKAYIDAVIDVMKELDTNGGKYDEDLAAGMLPHIRLADQMARAELIRRGKRKSIVLEPPSKEAAE